MRFKNKVINFIFSITAAVEILYIYCLATHNPIKIYKNVEPYYVQPTEVIAGLLLLILLYHYDKGFSFLNKKKNVQ